MVQILRPQVLLISQKSSIKLQSVSWSSIRVRLFIGVVCRLIELLVGQQFILWLGWSVSKLGRLSGSSTSCR